RSPRPSSTAWSTASGVAIPCSTMWSASRSRAMQPIPEKAGRVALDPERPAPEALGESDRRPHGLLRGLLAARDLDREHEVRRVEPVEADDPLGPVGRGGDRRDRQPRRVRGENRGGSRQARYLLKKR